MSFPEDGLDAAELKGFALHAAHRYAETLFGLLECAGCCSAVARNEQSMSKKS